MSIFSGGEEAFYAMESGDVFGVFFLVGSGSSFSTTACAVWD
jgi:hypothetical protein